jgi:alpha-galactosidase/6-phospho-beta-glucosidase family protein
MSTLIDSEYSVLHGRSDVAEHERAGLLSDLEAEGIDGQELQNDFVSYSTLSRHLQECLDETKQSANERQESDWETAQVRIARERYREKAEEALRSLHNKGKISGVDDAVLEIPLYLSCSECPTRVRLQTALNQGYVCSDHRGDTGEQRVDAAEQDLGQS